MCSRAKASVVNNMYFGRLLGASLFFAAFGWCPPWLSPAVSKEVADPEPYRFFAVQAENDLYVADGDRHYTNGVRIAYGFRENARPRALRWLRHLLPMKMPETLAFEVAIGQNLYTPEIFFIPDPIPDDRPFAAWVFADAVATARKPGREESLVLTVGWIGEPALGDESQSFFHSIFGAPEPLGWDNQLRAEPTLQFRYQRSHFLPLIRDRDHRVRADIVPRVGGSLGNVFIDIGAGLTFRLGSNLVNRDTPLAIPPGLNGQTSRFEVRSGKVDWLIFAGGTARAVFHNLFLDGNSFRDSLSVDRRTFVWDTTAGAMLIFGFRKTPIAISFTHALRAREFNEQIGRNRIGSLQVSIGF
ncbi:MAG: lipid A deacylase LpxR family protein [Pseudomonadota bacterium]